MAWDWRTAADARLILELRARDYVTPALRDLHWLPVPQGDRVQAVPIRSVAYLGFQ